MVITQAIAATHFKTAPLPSQVSRVGASTLCFSIRTNKPHQKVFWIPSYYINQGFYIRSQVNQSPLAGSSNGIHHQTRSFCLPISLANVKALGTLRPLPQCIRCATAHFSFKYFALSGFAPISVVGWLNLVSSVLFTIRSMLSWCWYKWQ